MQAIGMPVAAQLSIVGNRTTPPTYLEEEFISVDPELAAHYRAVAPSTIASPIVALLSTGASAQQVEVQCFTENGSVTRRSVGLAPGQMAALAACNPKESFDPVQNGFESAFQGTKNQPEAVALDVSTNASPGSLAVWGASSTGGRDSGEHQARTALNFTNIASLRSNETIFAGVPVGTADLLPGDTFKPDLAVANFGNKLATVSVSYSVMIGNSPQTQTLATLSLVPGAVKHLHLPNLNGDPLVRNSFVIASDADPGTVIGNLVLRGQQQYPAVQLIGKDAEVNNGGGHPWNIEGANQSTALLFNRSDKPELFNVNIVAQGKKWHQEYRLQPNETKAISIGDLIANRVKDLRGATLPVGAKTGEISWFTVDPGKGTGRVLVSNPETGLARNFSCGYNLVLCGTVLYNDFQIFGLGYYGSLGDLYSSTCTAYNPQACSGGQYDTEDGGYAITWSSNDPSIAPLSGPDYTPSASFYGQSTGAGTGTGQMQSQYCQAQSQGTNQVNPTIQITNLAFNPISINTTSPPTSTTLTVQVQFLGTISASHTFTVNVSTASSSPTSNNVSYDALSRDFTLSSTSVSPANVTFAVSANTATTQGSVTTGASLSTSDTGLTILAANPPGNAQKSLTTVVQ